MVCFQSTPASVGRFLKNRRICGDRNCSRRATVPLGIDTLIANILVILYFQNTFYNILFCYFQNTAEIEGLRDVAMATNFGTALAANGL